LYLTVSLHAASQQQGLMPISTQDYQKHPLTNGIPSALSELIESFHIAVGDLWCFLADLNHPNRGMFFDWFNRDSRFIQGALKVSGFY
jgi:hypothetical protein